MLVALQAAVAVEVAAVLARLVAAKPIFLPSSRCLHLRLVLVVVPVVLLLVVGQLVARLVLLLVLHWLELILLLVLGQFGLERLPVVPRFVPRLRRRQISRRQDRLVFVQVHVVLLGWTLFSF